MSYYKRRSWSYSSKSIDVPRLEEAKFFLAKNQKKFITETKMGLMCQGKRHYIMLRFPSRITLLNHPSKKGEALMIKLGGEKPACLIFLEQLKNNLSQIEIGRPLVREYHHYRNEAMSLRRNANARYSDSLHLDFHQRILNRLENINESLRIRVKKTFDKGYERNKNSYGYYNRNGLANESNENYLIRPTIKLSFKEKSRSNLITKEENNDRTNF